MSLGMMRPGGMIRSGAIVLVALLGIGGALAQATAPASAAASKAAAKAMKKSDRESVIRNAKPYYGVTCDQRYVMPNCIYDPSRDNHTGGS